MGVATFTATTTIENNFLILAQLGVTAACIAYGGYHINSIFIKTKVHLAALEAY